MGEFDDGSGRRPQVSPFVYQEMNELKERITRSRPQESITISFPIKGLHEVGFGPVIARANSGGKVAGGNKGLAGPHLGRFVVPRAGWFERIISEVCVRGFRMDVATKEISDRESRSWFWQRRPSPEAIPSGSCPEPTPAIRILVADDHQVGRRGLRRVLETQSSFEICGEAVDGRDAVEKVRQLNPDVVILNIGLPGMNGLEPLRQIRKVSPRTQVLVLTVYESEPLVRDVLGAGAHGYLLKSLAVRRLWTAVKCLHEHKLFFSLPKSSSNPRFPG